MTAQTAILTSELRTASAFRRYLLNELRAGSSHWPAAQHLVHNAAAELVERSAFLSPPVDISAVARMLNVCVNECSEITTATLGRLIPVRGGFVVYLSGIPASSDRPYAALTVSSESERNASPKLDARARFTFAHEIGHTLFYETPGADAIPRRLTQAPEFGSPGHRREEGLCHDFARALLIPDQCRVWLPPHPDLRALIGMARALRVGIEPLVRRVLHDWGAWDEVAIIDIAQDQAGPRATVLRGRSVSRTRAIPTGRAVQHAIGLGTYKSAQAALLSLSGPRLRSTFTHGNRTIALLSI